MYETTLSLYQEKLLEVALQIGFSDYLFSCGTRSVNESLCSAAQHCMYLYILKVFGFNFFPGSQQVHVIEYFHFTLIYYMATIVHVLWLAAEQALWNFFSAQRLFWVVSKTTCT